jgi:hypothetical protein
MNEIASQAHQRKSGTSRVVREPIILSGIAAKSIEHRRCMKELKFAPEAKNHGSYDEKERDDVIPPHVFAQIDPRKRYEHAKCDHFLDDLQLKSRELAVADSVRGNLEAIFEEGDQPAHDNHSDERRLFVLQMTVPGDRHKNIGANEKEDGFHSAES